MSKTPLVSTIGRASAATRVARSARATILCSKPGLARIRGLVEFFPQFGACDGVGERTKPRTAERSFGFGGQACAVRAEQHADRHAGICRRLKIMSRVA